MVEKGKTVTQPAAPEKIPPEGSIFVFLGWYDKNGTEYNFSTPVNEVITLKAKWGTYNVGDIIFSDGRSVAYTSELTLTNEQKQNAIAVIYKVDGGKAYGVGLAHNQDGLAWCSESANAYSRNIDSIWCKPDDGGSPGSYTFSNKADKDGTSSYVCCIRAFN